MSHVGYSNANISRRGECGQGHRHNRQYLAPLSFTSTVTMLSGHTQTTTRKWRVIKYTGSTKLEFTVVVMRACGADQQLSWIFALVSVTV